MDSLKRVFVIEWKGPFYDLESIKEEDFRNSFYLITGRLAYQRNFPEIQYCGISAKRTIYNRLSDKGHKHNKVTKEKQIWIGEFSNPKLNTTDNIELAESLIIYFWDPMLNCNKRTHPPKYPVSIINRWKFQDGRFRKKRNEPAQMLADVIFYDGNDFLYAECLKKKVFKIR